MAATFVPLLACTWPDTLYRTELQNRFSASLSTEALIRARGDILHGRPAAVIEYGKLGRSVAAMLHAKHVGVTVYDSDPVRRTQALSQGFRTASTLAQAIAGAGVIVCATGNLALREDDFAKVANRAVRDATERSLIAATWLRYFDGTS
ncbi:hypothetical protein [Actinomadura alba]|nr:hypothetical protein [Actinomadura alba]